MTTPLKESQASSRDRGETGTRGGEASELPIGQEWSNEQLALSIDIRYADSDNIAVRMLTTRDQARDARLLAYTTARLTALAKRLERDIDQAEDARSMHIAAAAALGSLKALLPKPEEKTE